MIYMYISFKLLCSTKDTTNCCLLAGVLLFKQQVVSNGHQQHFPDVIISKTIMHNTVQKTEYVFT